MNILGGLWNQLSIIIGDPKNHQEVLTHLAAYLGGLLTQKTGKLENRGLSCQSFSKILRISEKVSHETHQKLKIAV
jgi:hypothetical protein